MANCLRRWGRRQIFAERRADLGHDDLEKAAAMGALAVIGAGCACSQPRDASTGMPTIPPTRAPTGPSRARRLPTRLMGPGVDTTGVLAHDHEVEVLGFLVLEWGLDIRLRFARSAPLVGPSEHRVDDDRLAAVRGFAGVFAR